MPAGRIRNFFLPVIFLLLFTHCFTVVVENEWEAFFRRSLAWHDENVNSTVSSNLRFRLFPPMVRVNPLVERFSDWRNGPYWQHIPPLFTYVPLPFFYLDGKATAETWRLSYALLAYLTGCVFILIVTRFTGSLLSLATATAAAVVWINTPFTKDLLTARAFNYSDVVLAFTMVCSLAAICNYLRKPYGERCRYANYDVILPAMAVTLPVMAKSLLGGIAPALFFSLLFRDQRKVNRKVVLSIAAFAIPLIVYYGSLCLSSPDTFVKEMLVPFAHFKNYENWARPWHYYITNYLPTRYMHKYWIVYLLSTLTGLSLLLSINGRATRDFTILALSFTWFIVNLAAVSAIKSKTPNFIFQGYLFYVFFCIHCVAYVCVKTIAYGIEPRLAGLAGKAGKSYFKAASTAFVLLSFALLLTLVAWDAHGIATRFEETRASHYHYTSTQEKQFFFGEIAHTELNADPSHIFIIVTNDEWFKYAIIFNTGAEAKELRELGAVSRELHKANSGLMEEIKRKYSVVHFVFEPAYKLPGFLAMATISDYRVVTVKTRDYARFSNSVLESLKKVGSGAQLMENIRSLEFLSAIDPYFYSRMKSLLSPQISPSNYN
ncbi:MAG: hypothetical protein HQK89_09235 [Nitrospirae bacterium]|nr:hypothetical protein [Nitrospirota bacterium]